LIVVRHDVAAEGGRLEVRSRDAKGQWNTGGGVAQNSFSSEFEQALSSADVTDLSSLQLLQQATNRSFLPTTPHPSAAFSRANAGVYGGTLIDIACAGMFVSESDAQSSSSSFKVETSSQIFYFTVTPPVPTNLTSPSSSVLSLPSLLLLSNQLEASSWFARSSGAGAYQEGWRGEQGGVELVRGRGRRTSEWDRIVRQFQSMRQHASARPHWKMCRLIRVLFVCALPTVSPITWVLLFLVFLVILFGGWIYLRRYREVRRIAAMRHVDATSDAGAGAAIADEVERVLSHAPVGCISCGGGEAMSSSSPLHAHAPRSAVTSSHPPTSSSAVFSSTRPEEQRPALLRAPPNSARVDVEMVTLGGTGSGAMNNSNVGLGVLLHQLAPETASLTVTPQRADSRTSLRVSSHPSASSPIVQPVSASSSEPFNSSVASPPVVSANDLSPSLVRVAAIADGRSMQSSASPSCETPHTASSRLHSAAGAEVFSPSAIVDVADEEPESKEANDLEAGDRTEEVEEDPFRR
jgi:hypothetical protein